jgi:hypothetical protein
MEGAVVADGETAGLLTGDDGSECTMLTLLLLTAAATLLLLLLLLLTMLLPFT